MSEARFCQLLAEMSVLSEAATAKLDGDRVHGGEPDRSPHGPNQTLQEHFANRWNGTRNPVHRATILEDAELAIVEARYSPRLDVVPNTLEWRIAIANHPAGATAVARIFAVDRRTVYKLRKQFKP